MSVIPPIQEGMEGSLEKDCTALGSLFQHIISDMRGSSPVWEDFSSKATKLHSSLKTTLIAVSSFLEAFQKVADMATGSRGATKEIGTALTRLCMRHRSIESKLKTFTSCMIDNLVTPLQEKVEEWKKAVAQLDKEHAKEYKKARQEIKKAASDTMRLQKKVKKGRSDVQNRLDSAMQEVNDKYLLLEETEKHAVRNALIEERSRFCLFISCIKPFVDGEVSLLSEVTHLQEIIDSLCMQASEPNTLPQSSEQVIVDLKGVDTNVWNFQQPSPPSSPSSLGSRKSSMCSINSITSSSSGSTKSHSPSHQAHNKNLLQQPTVGSMRLTSVSSQDSGFTSQDTLFLRPATPSSLNLQSKNSCSDNGSNGTDTPEGDETPSTPSDSYPNTPSASSTWNNWPNPPCSTKSEQGRPHTISSAYEKSHHSRPPLNPQLFEPPVEMRDKSQLASAKTPEGNSEGLYEQHRIIKHDRPHTVNTSPYARPTSATINKMQPVLPPLGPKPRSKAVAPPKIPTMAGEPPVYVNMAELANMAAEKIREQEQDQEEDAEKTPTSKNPPPLGQPQSATDMLDLEAAIRSLDSCTAALHTDYHPELGTLRKTQNNLELAEAIRELEASTAALNNAYDTGSHTSRSSLQCSSGYGTMNSTPASSEDTIATGDFDLIPTDIMPEQEKYFTIPRNGAVSYAFRAAFSARRPASTAGIPVSHSGQNLTRRSSMNNAGPKPPPPVRRTASITSANPVMLQKMRSSPPKQLVQHQQQRPPQGQPPTHRRSQSMGGDGEPAYAELQEIQQSIHTRQQRQQQQQTMHYASTDTQHYASAPQTPQYAIPLPGLGGSADPLSASKQASVINSLSAKFAQINARRCEDGPIVTQLCAQQTEEGPSITHGENEEFPLPPTEDELREIEEIYSTTRPPQPQPNATTVRQSLISELKHGQKLRKISSPEDISEV